MECFMTVGCSWKDAVNREVKKKLATRMVGSYSGQRFEDCYLSLTNAK